MKFISDAKLWGNRGLWWTFSFFFSCGLALFILLLAVTISAVFHIKHQEMAEVGWGFAMVLVFWPGILTASIILFDGLYMKRISLRYLGKAIGYGAVPIVIYYVVDHFGVIWYQIEMVGVRSIDMMLSFVIYIALSVGVAILALSRELAKPNNAKGVGEAAS